MHRDGRLDDFNVPEREKQEAEAETIEMRAQADAKATTLQADADRLRFTPAYVRLRALELLAQAMSNGKDKLIVLPAVDPGRIRRNDFRHSEDLMARSHATTASFLVRGERAVSGS